MAGVREVWRQTTWGIDEKRPDNASLIPWSMGKCLGCDQARYTHTWLLLHLQQERQPVEQPQMRWLNTPRLPALIMLTILLVAVETSAILDNEPEECLQQVRCRSADALMYGDWRSQGNKIPIPAGLGSHSESQCYCVQWCLRRWVLVQQISTWTNFKPVAFCIVVLAEEKNI